MLKKLVSLSVLSVFASTLLLIGPNLASADTSLSANTTVANVSEVKATRTITVNSVPGTTQTIGLCVITFSNGTQDVNCSDNAALVNTTTDNTAAAVASRIRTITGISDTGHGALTVGGSASTATFTTTGTETSATAITASSNGAITNNTVSTTGVVPVAQTSTFTFSNISSPYYYTVTINSRDYTSLFLGGLLQSVVTDLKSSLASDPSVSCSNSTSLITCVSRTAGTAFTAAASTVILPPPVNLRAPSSSRSRAAAMSSLKAMPAGIVSASVAPPTTAASVSAPTPKAATVVAPAPVKVVAPAPTKTSTKK